jgi:hypothetical protein
MENNRPFRRTTSRWTARPTLEIPSAMGKKADHHRSPPAVQGDGPSAPLDRRARVSALIVGAVAIVLLASVPTSARAAEDSTRISHACAAVMGLDPSEEPYEDCVRSLERTLSKRKGSELTDSSRSQCAQKGLDPGTAAFDTCVVKAEQSPSGSGRDRAVVPAR